MCGGHFSSSQNSTDVTQAPFLQRVYSDMRQKRRETYESLGAGEVCERVADCGGTDRKQIDVTQFVVIVAGVVVALVVETHQLLCGA